MRTAPDGTDVRPCLAAPGPEGKRPRRTAPTPSRPGFGPRWPTIAGRVLNGAVRAYPSGTAADPPSCDAVAEFVGRGWLVDAVRRWASTESGYLFITGGPGTGKSAAVQHLWGDAPVAGTAVYRCRAASRSSCDPVRFAESLAEQFSTTVPGFAEALARVARERSGRAGELRIEGTAGAGTVQQDASVIGVRVTFSHVTADEAFEQLVCRPLSSSPWRSGRWPSSTPWTKRSRTGAAVRSPSSSSTAPTGSRCGSCSPRGTTPG